MKVILDEDEIKVLESTAKRGEISAEQLFNAYEGTMASNFDQDVEDIASELSIEQANYEMTSFMNDKEARKEYEYNLAKGDK